MSGPRIVEKPFKEKLLPEVENENKMEAILNSSHSQETESVEQIYKIEEIPLLTMNNDEYSKFLEHHQSKVVC